MKISEDLVSVMKVIRSFEIANARLQQFLPNSDGLSRQTFQNHLEINMVILQDLHKQVLSDQLRNSLSFPVTETCAWGIQRS